MLAYFRQSGRARFALVSAVLTGFLLALALAASPQLHELAHDADHSEQHHECLATVLSEGGLDTVLVIATLVQTLPEPRPVAIAVQDLHPVQSFFLSCRVLEHAPPQSLLS